MNHAWKRSTLGVLLALASLTQFLAAQVGRVQKISATQGGLEDELPLSGRFGESVTVLGDLDGDGVPDIAVGAPGPLGLILDVHGLWILRLHADGSVKAAQRIAEGEGGFFGPIDSTSGFGYALAALGDVNGDGRVELAVGDPLGGTSGGAVWILSLEADGTVAGQRCIDDDDMAGVLGPGEYFGFALAAPGDLDGDGRVELLVGAPRDRQDVPRAGAFYTLSLEPSLGVYSFHKIRAAEVDAAPLDLDFFGGALALLDDLDGDGRRELAVGAPGPFFAGPTGAGSVWILFLADDGSVRDAREIGNGVGGLDPVLEDGDRFGSELASFDDLDGDGLGELLVGAEATHVGGSVDVGRFWILHLDPDGRVREAQAVGFGSGGFPDVLEGGAHFGSGLAVLPDLDRDGFRDLVVGSSGDRDGASGTRTRGAVWLLFLDQGLAPLVRPYGCGLATAGSLTLLAGAPRLGSTFLVGLTNPLGTQSPGSIGTLRIATRPHPLYPCGLVVPGMGMASPGSPGEILLDGTALAPGFLISRQGAAWSGVGSHVPFTLRVPLEPALLDTHLYLQGLLADPVPPHLGLSEALDVRLGSPAPPPMRSRRP